MDEEFSKIDPNIALNRFLEIKTMAHNIFLKYHYANMNYDEILERCKKIFESERLNTKEIELFHKIYAFMHKKSLYNQTQNKKMTDTFGNIKPAVIQNNNYKQNNENQQYIDEIMTIAKTNKNEFMRAVFQSNLYTNDEVTNLLFAHNPSYSEFVNDNVTCAIHPVIIALFALKINILDNRIIHTNLAKIIVDRLNNEPLRTKHDFEFYMDLITNQQQIVCDKFNTFADLKKRVNIQETLRDTIWNLRGGKLYDCKNISFLNTIDDCSLNPVESPIYNFIRDEGTVLRRILNVFCIKPTFVTTMPVFDLTRRTMPIHKMDKLSMINVNLPNQIVDSYNEPVDLKAGLDTPHWYYENGLIVPKKQNILYSKELLIFYVNRKFRSMPSVYNNVYRYRRLPVSIGNHERINRHEVNYKFYQKVNQQLFRLQSVVCVSSFSKNDGEESKIQPYTGCYTILFAHNKKYHYNNHESLADFEDYDLENQMGENEHIIAYDPYRQCTLTNDDNTPLVSTSNKRGFTIINTDEKYRKHSTSPYNPNIYDTNGQKNIENHIRNEGHIFIYTEPMETISDLQTIDSFEINYAPKYS